MKLSLATNLVGCCRFQILVGESAVCFVAGVSLSSSSEVVQQNVISDLGGRTNGVNQQQRQTEDDAGGDHDSESSEGNPEASSLLSTSSAQNQSVHLQDAARPQENLQADGSEQTSIGQKAAKKSQRRVSFHLQLPEQPKVTFRRRSKSTGDDDDVGSVLLEEQTPTEEEHII